MTKKKEIKVFRERVFKGVKIAVGNALEEHKKVGRSIVIRRNGRIVHVPPDEIQITEG